jgi:hypothetical protein
MATPQSGNWRDAFRDVFGKIVYAENVDGTILTPGIHFSDGTFQTTAAGAGAASLNITTAASANIPSPLFSPSLVPASLNPFIYAQDINGNYHPLAGIDVTTADGGSGNGPKDPAGILTWFQRQYYRDNLSSTQLFKNAFMSINHLAGVGTSQGNQDRGLAINIFNSTSSSITSFSIASNITTINTGTASSWVPGQHLKPAGLAVGTYLNGVDLTVLTSVGSVLTLSGLTHADVTTTGDSGTLDQTMYGLEGIQVEIDVKGTPVFTGTPDGEMAAASFQCNFAAAGDIATPSYGASSLRLSTNRSGAGRLTGGQAYYGLRSNVFNNAAGDLLDTPFIAGYFTAADFFSSANGIGYGVLIDNAVAGQGGARFLALNIGLAVGDFGTHANDYAIRVLGGLVQLGDNLALNNTNGRGSIISQYNGINTVSNGVPAEFATVDSTGLVASTGTVTLYAVPATGAGQYRVSGNAKITTTGTSPVIGPLTITYTDPDGTVCAMIVPSSNSAGTVSASGNAANSATATGVMLFSTILVNAKLSTNIQYSFPVSGTVGAGAWNLHLKLEAM